ncbi:MAG: phosphoribosylglycinamide formyltransferase [Proteobacteria bacterium]|jgi:phosphoribosylglycinamide formyltransferase 1|nr:phosphoribosylglycinamide formyltransferase [Pseudomonadota bacterium]MDA1352035.1 phosphoribosylglycinamide formyltransferase [Pseudomonadota bacterium]
MSAGQKPRPRIVILISGSGSNLQSLIDACLNNKIKAQITAVISNKPNVKGVERATAANIPTIIIDHRDFNSRPEFDLRLLEAIKSFSPDLVVLAGFMRILTTDFVNQFEGKLLNIHPSLLPAYQGLDTHQRAIAAGDSKAGATVHFVTPELDGGPPILQAEVEIMPTDSAQDLAARVLKVEHRIYPTVVQWFCDGRLKAENGKAFLDGTLIGSNGILFDKNNER